MLCLANFAVSRHARRLFIDGNVHQWDFSQNISWRGMYSDVLNAFQLEPLLRKRWTSPLAVCVWITPLEDLQAAQQFESLMIMLWFLCPTVSPSSQRRGGSLRLCEFSLKWCEGFGWFLHRGICLLVRYSSTWHITGSLVVRFSTVKVGAGSINIRNIAKEIPAGSFTGSIASFLRPTLNFCRPSCPTCSVSLRIIDEDCDVLLRKCWDIETPSENGDCVLFTLCVYVACLLCGFKDWAT
jgi:hypothetical protein